MNTIFSLNPKKSTRAVNDNNAMMRLKMQNALYQKELNRVKAENAALALAAQQELAHKQALADQQQELARQQALAHQQQELARQQALARQQQELARQQQELARQQALARHQELARQQSVTPAPAPVPAPVPAPAPTNVPKKSKFNSLLSNMNEQRKKIN